MKVLVCARPGAAFGYISDGWINALRSRGHQVERWDNQRSTWDDFDPDLYIGCSGHKQNIPDDRKAKVAIHVNPYGPVNIPGFNNSLINESQLDIDWVAKQRPDVVFGYGFESDKNFWSYWESKVGIKWVPMPTAADKIIYNKLNVKKIRDIGYVGGYWPYKSTSINNFLLPVLSHGFDCKVHGWGSWPGNIASSINDDGVCIFYNQSRIVPCVSEPHTQQSGIDIPERMFKAIACGALAIHDNIYNIKANVSSIISADDPGDYLDLCRFYINDELARLEAVSRQYNEIMSYHTYHNRISNLLRTIACKLDHDSTGLWLDASDDILVE